MRAWEARGEKVINAALSQPHPAPPAAPAGGGKSVRCFPLNCAHSDSATEMSQRGEGLNIYFEIIYSESELIFYT